MPVTGSSDDDLRRAALTFLTQNLGLRESVSGNMIESVTPVRVPSGPGVFEEVLLVLANPRVRDLIVGASAKLANFKDADGRPMAGIRIEVPPFLTPSFKTLFRFGQTLRARHGVGTRRHVKFNDTSMSLYLNVCLPGDKRWSRVSLEV